MLGQGVSAGICPQHVVIHPTGKLLYVLAGGFAEGTEPTNPEQLTVFRIDATTGALKLVSTVTVGIGNFIGGLAIEPIGTIPISNGGLARKVENEPVLHGSDISAFSALIMLPI